MNSQAAGSRPARAAIRRSAPSAADGSDPETAGSKRYLDRTGLKVKGTGVTDYWVDPDFPKTMRHIKGTAEINGQSGTYQVDVADNGEPGRDDTFAIELSGAGYSYRAEGTLSGGNIQLHQPACQ